MRQGHCGETSHPFAPKQLRLSVTTNSEVRAALLLPTNLGSLSLLLPEAQITSCPRVCAPLFRQSTRARARAQATESAQKQVKTLKGKKSAICKLFPLTVSRVLLLPFPAVVAQLSLPSDCSAAALRYFRNHFYMKMMINI